MKGRKAHCDNMNCIPPDYQLWFEDSRGSSVRYSELKNEKALMEINRYKCKLDTVG